VAAFAFQALGSLLGVLVGLLILQVDPTLQAWRVMLAFGVLPAMVVVLMRKGLPESVRWHLERGNYEKASRAASTLLELPVTLTAKNSPPVEPCLSFGCLFQKRYLRRTIFASAPWFLQDISTYGIGIFTPTIMAAMALGGGATFIAKDIGATKGAAAVDLLLVVGFMLAIILVHHISRVTLQIAGFLGMALGLLIGGRLIAVCDWLGGPHGHDLRRLHGIQRSYEHGTKCHHIPAVRRDLPNLNPGYRGRFCGGNGQARSRAGDVLLPRPERGDRDYASAGVTGHGQRTCRSGYLWIPCRYDGLA
jgi:MFS family permease